MILPMENTEKMIFPGVGKYGIPEIKPETDIRIDKLEWIPVNYALTAKDKATKGVHFYKDDYQFERFWNNPDKYIPLLQQFGAVCSPDFSLYSDMPLAVQLFMHYKKHWLAAGICQKKSALEAIKSVVLAAFSASMTVQNKLEARQS